ncbi:hypothetical protein ABEW34_00015 [Paenibacillus algorifonticola]|uniref:hypothetical protein n=1 Tax=Paenibacillus algorifonticola TaxID=684063 RepID=UPI003D2D7F97
MKKFRGIRRHYRKIEKLIFSHQFHFEDESWYNHWHMHLDWKGLTDESIGHRKSHFKYYLNILDRIEEQSSGSRIDFQTWISINPEFGSDDAIYIHTKNPYSEFPVQLLEIEWDIEVPELLKELINSNEYVIGRAKHETSYSYYIYKIGIGIPLK